MGAGRVMGLLLLLVVVLMMPGAAEKCGEREYLHDSFCCEFCDAGYFVADHCNTSHSRGKCEPCKEGKDFAAHENGLEECSPCRQCREDQITLRPCTLTQDTECQCKEGYSCPDWECEMCQRNNQTYPDGKEIVPSSTGTTDPALSSQGKEGLHWVIPLIVAVVLVVVISVCFLLVKKLKHYKAAPTDAEGGWMSARRCSCDATSCDSYKVQEPSQIIVEDLSQNELTETFHVFIKEVPPQQWNRLMETVLQENDINEIISKFPNNREEQSYEMLLIWRNRLGQKQCIIKLLDALRYIDTKAYYSISSTLKSNNIIS